jgi:hypothetical protein
MNLTYQTYPFTPTLGWSISRYEMFDKCKRQYFFNYYAKFAKGIPPYKVAQLKALTSVPLEIGNVVHDIIEAFLRRLQKSDSDIDEKRFIDFAKQKTDHYFATKTFLETYYGTCGATVDAAAAFEKITACLENFTSSPIYTWLFMKAITNKDNWMIEPPGYGETRLAGLKAYCKMDFLFPVEKDIYILDWKTGGKDTYKHSHQLIGYAAAASSNFSIPWNVIFPKIIYLYPVFEEFELVLTEQDFSAFFERIVQQTNAMQAYCSDVENNVPVEMEKFNPTPSNAICRYCNFQELCFDKKNTSPSRDVF